MLAVAETESGMGAKIRVVGVGDIGNRTVNRMMDEQIAGVGWVWTDGVGSKAAEERTAGSAVARIATWELAVAVSGADMVFVVCDMGDGTGSGVVPVVAEAAREQGILTVGIVAKPSGSGETQCMESARSDIGRLKGNVDTLMVIADGRLSGAVDKSVAFSEVLLQIVQGIAGLINDTALINLDFEDVSVTMKDKGLASVGIGRAKGTDRALEAARYAIENPLTETALNGAGDVIIYIFGEINLSDMSDVQEAVAAATGEDSSVIFGARYDGAMVDEMGIIVIATSFEESGGV